MRYVFALAISMLTLTATGCTTADPGRLAWRNWAHQQGGLIVAGAAVDRAEAVMDQLHRAGCGGKVAVCVLDSDALAAYAWPADRIFVTRGLIEKTLPDELAAAMAHELGHLISDGHLAVGWSLQGVGNTLDKEQAADQFGCRMLGRAGMDRGAMERLLVKVRGAAPDPQLRSRIDQRIAHLRAG
ncbi:MAG: M48 family metalloprotease [Planctomycetes bacterium]|nr:M48 family metalloprotease [Planctomycetota bacterium]